MERSKVMFHPIISSIQKVALYETKTVSVFDYFSGFKLIFTHAPSHKW